MESILDIYIDQACPGCAHAQEIAKLVQHTLPQIEVRIHDLAHPDIEKPLSVFAVPTYVLDGNTFSLGNPDINKLVTRIEDSLNIG